MTYLVELLVREDGSLPTWALYKETEFDKPVAMITAHNMEAIAAKVMKAAVGEKCPTCGREE